MQAPSTKLTAVCALVAVLAAGCAQQQTTTETPRDTTGAAVPGDDAVVAVAELQPTQGNTARGTVTFTSVPEGVRIVADLAGLPPGEHGFHLHQNGDCSAPDGSSAGDHFNPSGMPHGGPTSPQRHAGDLGNIVADAEGNAHLDRVDPVLSMTGAESILDRAVIVHANADDLTSQPSGNAGPRLACGVVARK